MKTLSIACIDTNNHTKAELSINKTLNCLEKAQQPVKCIHWLSDKSFSTDCRAPVNFFQINKISNFPYDYNYHCLVTLPNIVQEDFVILVQWDGYAVNPDAWTQDFMCYDYIGAVWPPSLVQGKFTVGNGGFSLRSKRLLNYLQNLTIDYNCPEDNTIGIHNRIELESNGLMFAPEYIAHQFSIEQCWDNQWFTKSFGFHGLLTGTHYI